MDPEQAKVLHQIAQGLESIKANTDRALRELAARLEHVESVAESNRLLVAGLLTTVDEDDRRRMIDVLISADYGDETGMIRKRLEEFREGLARASSASK